MEQDLKFGRPYLDLNLLPFSHWSVSIAYLLFKHVEENEGCKEKKIYRGKTLIKMLKNRNGKCIRRRGGIRKKERKKERKERKKERRNRKVEEKKKEKNGREWG